MKGDEFDMIQRSSN